MLVQLLSRTNYNKSIDKIFGDEPDVLTTKHPNLEMF